MPRIPPRPRSREAAEAYQQVAQFSAAKFLNGENYQNAQERFERGPFHHFTQNLEAVHRAYYDGAKWIETVDHARLFDAWILQFGLLTAVSKLKRWYGESQSQRQDLWLTTRSSEKIRVDLIQSAFEGVEHPLEVLMTGVNQKGKVLRVESE